MEMGTQEEMQAALEEKYTEFNIADIKEIISILQEEKGVELTDEQLENIAGGQSISLRDFVFIFG